MNSARNWSRSAGAALLLACLALAVLALDLIGWALPGSAPRVPASAIMLIVLLLSLRYHSPAATVITEPLDRSLPAPGLLPAITATQLLGAFAFVDAQRRCTYVSPALASMLAVPCGEIEGQPIYKKLAEEIRGRLEK